MPENLLGKNPELPYQLQTEQAQLAVAQALATKLMEMGAKDVPATFAGGGMLFPNWGQQLTAQSQLERGERLMKETGTKQADLASRYNQMLAAAMQQYLDMRTGGGGAGGAPGVPNPVAATRMAVASGIPAMQAIGTKDIEGMPTGSKYLEYAHQYGPQSWGPFQQTMNPAALVPPIKTEYHQGVRDVTQGGVPLASSAVDPHGEPYTEPLTGLAVTKGALTNNPEPIARQYPAVTAQTTNLAMQGKAVEGTYAAALLAANGKAGVAQALSDLSSIPDSKLGTWSEQRLWMEKAAALFGGRLDPAVSNLEAARGQLQSLMATNGPKLYPWSDKDVQFAMNTVGQPNFTPAALKKLLAFMNENLDNTLAEHAKNTDIWAKTVAPNNPDRQNEIRQFFTPKMTQKVIPPATSATTSYKGTGRAPPVDQYAILKNELDQATAAGDQTAVDAITAEIKRYFPKGVPSYADLSQSAFDAEWKRQGGK